MVIESSCRFSQPLQVMDPDHPLAALVRRAKLESNGGYATAGKPGDAVEPPPASTPPPAQYAADREFAFASPLLSSPLLSFLHLSSPFLT